MPHKKPCVEALTLEALQHMADANNALERSDLGEMERQILQCGHMERYCNKMLQVATLKGEAALMKTMGEHATKWATNMRAATTKRKNDIVPSLVKAVTGGATWAEAVKALKKREED